MPLAGNRVTDLVRQCFSFRAVTPHKKERVVILGSGWAGYALARKLSRSRYESIVVSPRSSFVFTPLLASTTVGTLEFRAVLEPVRRLGLHAFHQGRVVAVDTAARTVHVEPHVGGDELSSNTAGVAPPEPGSSPAGFSLAYDHLVVAVGCQPQTFGVPGVLEHAHLLRTVADARRIRLRLLRLFELASSPTVPEDVRRSLLHLAVVGGGPTGIEFAAELHDLVQEDLPRLYPELVPLVSVTVYDVAPKVLPMFDQDLAAYAMDLFGRAGIKVLTETTIESISNGEKAARSGNKAGEEQAGQDSNSHADGDGDGKLNMGLLRLRIRRAGQPSADVAAGLVVWSTGLAQNPLMSQIDGVARDRRTGGLLTDGHLRVLDERSGGTAVVPGVYAIGDCAVVRDAGFPATAQVASQQAAHLARQLNRGAAAADGSEFRFRNLGTMAYLGGYRAIHQSSSKDDLRGRAAWVLWRTAYLTKSMSVRNKLKVVVYWMMTWMFGRDISRF